MTCCSKMNRFVARMLSLGLRKLGLSTNRILLNKIMESTISIKTDFIEAWLELQKLAKNTIIQAYILLRKKMYWFCSSFYSW